MDSSSGSIDSSAVERTSEQGYLWKYVTRVGRAGEGGGNCRWVCTFCNEEKTGSHTRVKAHLLKIPRSGITACKNVSPASLAEMKKLEEEAEKSKQDSIPKRVSLPTTFMFGSTTEPSGSNPSKRKKIGDSPLGKSFDMHARNQLDAEIARMFYTGGLPFNLARNPYYVSSYTFAANHALGGYVPPGYNKLRTTLLDQEKAHVERLLVPIKSTWVEKGVSIVSDGWSDPNRRPLINIMVVSESGPMFVRAVDCSGQLKDRHFIANLLKQVIIEVGPKNVVQVITDNAAPCKAAGELIESTFPHIYWTPCIVHSLNLALKSICAARNVVTNQETYELCHWITEVHGDAVQIKNFIMNHQMRLSMFNQFSPLELLSVADTRFASIVIMLKRLKLIRRALVEMVTSDKWAQWKLDDQGKARFVRDTILSEDWWEQLSYILDFTAPIYEIIRVCDTDKPTLHLAYDMWDSMIEKVKKVIYEHEGKELSDTCAFWEVIETILISRWAKNNTPLHCLAHSLNPKYYTPRWLSEGEKRVSPGKNKELADERIKCFKRLFTGEDRRAVTIEYANFSLQGGAFNDAECIAEMYELDPKHWWATYGAHAPLLQSLAVKLVGQPSSSSCCERNWSTYSFIHSFRRNRLTPTRAENLVFVHNNLRLLARSHPQYYNGDKSKMWDVGGDQFGDMDDVDVGVLEFAELTLDEPELESIVGNEDAIDDAPL